MSAALLTADWFLLGRDLYFRKFEIYSMAWPQEVNLENFILSCASYAGPIAILRDEQKIVRVQGTGQPTISIFSGSGKRITSFKWTKRTIVCMGWSHDEKLIFVLIDGSVVIHDMFGQFLHSFTIVSDVKIADAKIFTNPKNHTGIAVLTSHFKVYLINNILEPRTRQMSEFNKSTIQPTSWAVVSEDPQTEVLVAREKELFRLKQDEHHTSTTLEPDFTNNYTSILEISISFNARHVALFTDSGILWLGSSNLRTKYCEIDTNIIHKPKQLIWCGNEAVIAYWERDNTVLIVGKYGQKMSYTYDSSVHLSAEIDGVRIISNTQHELLQKVPDVVQKIFRINSTDPGSFLLEASKHYQKRSHRANEYICLVKKDLKKAVEQCIDAVGYEFDTEVQKMLVRAAQFGKCFIADMQSDKYVNIIRLLRVLNALRDPKIGIPITFEQLKHLTQKVLLDRLITRKEYYLALQIAKYLKIPEEEGISHILLHWAKYKVSQSLLEEETVAREIADKLGYTPGISYSEIASTAAEHGRKKLAIKLLDYESKASDQVKLLLELRENTPAIVKAIESGNTDLVYMVILKLREKMALGEFKMMIRNFPVAQALYIKFCKEQETHSLNEIYIQEDDFSSQAQMFILDSLDNTKNHMRDSLLTSALEAYRKGRKDLNASMVEEYLKLYRYQKDLDEKFRGRFKSTGKTIHETCKLLLENNEMKLAEKFKNDFKIPDKRYWWLRIQSLALMNDWVELEKLSKFKKSPIGYAPFVDVCLSKDNKIEAMKYLPKVNEDIKVKYYIKAGCLEEAAKIAFDQKDIQSLLYVQSKCSSQSSLSEKVNGLIMQLNSKK